MVGHKRVTDKQLAANRRNAQRSTGPRTPEGKAAVRYNALKHGILAKAIIPEALEAYESREDFDGLLATLHDEFAPANALEELLVEQIASCYWRLARLYRAEAGAIAKHQEAIERDRSAEKARMRLRPSAGPSPPDPLAERMEALETAWRSTDRLRSLMTDIDPALADASDQEVSAAADREIDRLVAAMKEREARKEAQQRAVDRAVRSLPDPDTALKYARYETALQNQLHRALSSLERLQRQRLGDHVPAPGRLDVTLEVAGGDVVDVEG